MFPIYIYNEGVELPDEGSYYVIAGNGNFLHKDTGIVRCFVSVKEVSFLADIDPTNWVSLTIPKIPAEIVQKIKQFFKEVVLKYGTEANSTLYYNKITEKFKIHISEQIVSHGAVHYNRRLIDDELLKYKDFLRIGTIHSHCDFGAFHSGTDIKDEKDFDGLHVTFGNNDKEEITITASVVVNGCRTEIPPENVLCGIKLFDDKSYYLENQIDYDISSWMAKIHPESFV